MITLDGFPRNKEKYRRLLDFSTEVLEICQRLDVEVMVDGSLAVFAYTKNQDLQVNDIDLACSESAFPRITAALDTQGTKYRLREWHVLQVVKDDLRIELCSLEHWYHGLPMECGRVVLGGREVKILGLESLRTLYRRGVEQTAKDLSEGNNRLKNESYRAKYAALSAISQDHAA